MKAQTTTNRKTQTRMFTHEDLPLFTGGAIQAQASEHTPTAPAPKQTTLWACPFCKDTGQTGEARKGRDFCQCKAGAQARAEYRAMGRGI